jgi:hypothetical protein
MLDKKELKSRVLSHIMHFAYSNRWIDSDDFLLTLADKITDLMIEGKFVSDYIRQILQTTKTSFFIANKLTKERFIELFKTEVQDRLGALSKEITITLTTLDIFAELGSVTDSDAEANCDRLSDLDERVLQDSLRSILRSKGATPIPERERDTAQEVADIELFQIKVKDRTLKFVVVVKGYKSIPGKTLTWKDVAHQIMRAYQRGKPNHIILASAKDPADSLITSLSEYSSTVRKPNLVIFIPPRDLVKILLAHGLI